VNLLDSLLDAIVRLEGDALVMHVGEKPYIVTATSAMSEFRGPLLWGHVDLSTRVLTSEALLGLLGQILPVDERQALTDLGAIEYQIDAPEKSARFSVIAARAGDEIWVEVRRRPKEAPVVVETPAVDEPLSLSEPAAESQVAAAEPQIAAIEPQIEPSTETPVAVPGPEPIHEPVAPPIEQPVYVADTIEAVDQSAVMESPVAASGDDLTAPIHFEEPAAEARVGRDEMPDAPFEIVYDVNQDAPTEADVDALLAETAASLSHAGDDMLEGAPAEIDHHRWPEPEPEPEPLSFEPAPESVAPEPLLIAEAPLEDVPAPMALASQVDSIAIAPELEPISSASELEYAPMISTVEPLMPLGQESKPETFAEEFRHDAEPTELTATDFIAPGEEASSELLAAGVEGQPVASVDEYAPDEQELLEPELPDCVPEPVVTIPEHQLLLAGMAAAYTPVVLAEGFYLVPPSAESFVLEPVEIEREPERVALTADEQPQSFRFTEGIPGDRALEEPLVFERIAIASDGLPAVAGGGPSWEPAALAEDFDVEEAFRLPSPMLASGPSTMLGQEPSSPPEPVSSPVLEPAVNQSVAEPEFVGAPAVVPAEAPSAAVQSETPTVPIVQPEPVMASAPIPEPTVQPAVAPLVQQPIRKESTSSTTANGAPEFSIDELLRAAAARGASTVYLVARSRPMVRAGGDISALEIGTGTPLQESDIAHLALELAPETVRDAWERGTSAEWIADVPEVGRVRCMTFRDHRGPGLIFRMIPPQAISADHLGLSPEVQALCAQSDGLVLVTGPRLNGKSTLMSGFVDLINRTRSDHVITIESQIEFVHESQRSFVSQREVHSENGAVASAVRSAVREDADVLFIGELSSAEVATAAFEAAESGRLVFASLPASSTVAAVERLLELLPSNGSDARTAIAESLRGVVAEVLVGRTRGGRVAAREVLLNTAAVAGLIQEAKTDQLPVAMETGRRHGMMPLNDVLVALVREGTVHVAEAYRKAFDKESLLAALRQEGVDTSFAEKPA
jgi:twitching motility protein PilT